MLAGRDFLLVLVIPEASKSVHEVEQEGAAELFGQADRQEMPCKVGSALRGTGKTPKSKRQL